MKFGWTQPASAHRDASRPSLCSLHCAKLRPPRVRMVYTRTHRDAKRAMDGAPGSSLHSVFPAEIWGHPRPRSPSWAFFPPAVSAAPGKCLHKFYNGYPADVPKTSLLMKLTQSQTTQAELSQAPGPALGTRRALETTRRGSPHTQASWCSRQTSTPPSPPGGALATRASRHTSHVGCIVPPNTRRTHSPPTRAFSHFQNFFGSLLTRAEKCPYFLTLSLSLSFSLKPFNTGSVKERGRRHEGRCRRRRRRRRLVASDRCRRQRNWRWRGRSNGDGGGQ